MTPSKKLFQGHKCRSHITIERESKESGKEHFKVYLWNNKRRCMEDYLALISAVNLKVITTENETSEKKSKI